MSASLVGSEMCIRDRHTGRAAASGGSSPPGPEVSSRHDQCDAPDGKPVSYTHLTLPTICSV
eukprot:14636149-Alexandrium_andersonii.AAC.1